MMLVEKRPSPEEKRDRHDRETAWCPVTGPSPGCTHITSLLGIHSDAMRSGSCLAQKKTKNDETHTKKKFYEQPEVGAPEKRQKYSTASVNNTQRFRANKV